MVESISSAYWKLQLNIFCEDYLILVNQINLLKKMRQNQKEINKINLNNKLIYNKIKTNQRI